MRAASTLLVVALATITLSTEIASACGGGEFRPRPQVMMVTTHGFIKKGKWQRRAFVVLDELASVDAKLKWVWLGPGTYDSTEVAELAALDTPVELTLAGPTGTRVVKASRRFAIRHSFHLGDKPRVAIEVPLREGDGFTIAMPGRVSDAKWHELGFAEGGASTTWWLQKLGVKALWTGVRPVSDQLEVVEFSTEDKSGFALRRGGDELGRYDGAAVGAVTWNGRKFLVMDNQAHLGAIELPQS